MKRQLYFSDSETFKHDNLWVFKRQSDGLTLSFWNDPDGVAEFIADADPVLCGFNFRDYDSHILKATLLNWSPEDIKRVNDTIMESDDRSMVWVLFNGQPFVELPPIIDLFHDIVPRKGLKEIEANIGMDIVESSVPFDIDRKLTEAEREEVLRYCVHDVEATEALYDLRFDYLKSKSDLCELRGVDPLTMLKHTNARIVSEVLQAERIGKLPYEEYEIPANVDQTAIPQPVIDYVLQWNTDNCTIKQPETCDFMFHDCPTVVGLGGIHAAVPSYKETASDERVILIQDIGSYYPSLIINNGYMSRAVPDASAYKAFYDMRMKAKAEGDKATAEAAKLVLNTTYGTMKDTYNKMFDPMQATRVCLSGQLYILDLIEQMYRAVPEGLQLIQLNTDGWVISIKKAELDTINDVVRQWCERTGFTVDTDFIETIVQANVNNYVMRTVDGKVKAKGGIVARRDGGDFKSNSMTIIDKAVSDYLLDGTPVEKTVRECDDIERFQIIAKAGRTFQKVIHEYWSPADPVPLEVQRCNRVYATYASMNGGVYKLKLDEEGKEIGRSKIPLTPEHCFVDNENLWKGTQIGLTTLDKSWYVALAQNKAAEFLTRKKEEREQMAEANEVHNEVEDTPKPVARRKSNKKDAEQPAVEVQTFTQKLLRLQQEMTEAATGVTFDKAVANINHEYADTQQYKAWLALKCSQIGLIFGLDIANTQYLGMVSDKSHAVLVEGNVILTDVDTAESTAYGVSGLGVNVQPGYCLGGAQTNLLRNFILNGFLLDNMGREGDDVAMNALDGAKTEGKAYVSQGEKAVIKDTITSSKKTETCTVMFAEALHEKILEARAIDPEFATKTLTTHFNEDGTPKVGEDGRSTMKKTTATKAMTQAEEIIAKAAE